MLLSENGLQMLDRSEAQTWRPRRLMGFFLFGTLSSPPADLPMVWFYSPDYRTIKADVIAILILEILVRRAAG